jgi:1,2-diacylglycerol 3-beta-galactosyltransferase
MKHVLILIISGGGGHSSAARSLAKALTRLYGHEVRTTVVDVSKEHWFGPVNRLDDAFYWLTSDGVGIWKLLWNTDGKTRLLETLARALTPFFRGPLSRIYRDQAPDLVVAMHSLVNHVPLRVLRKTFARHVPFATVVTDMVSVHSAWFCSDVDYCTVPTEPAHQRALELGMPPDRVEVIGQPVDMDFAVPLSEPRDLRRRLGLEPDLPCALLVGGGDGMGPLYETARALAGVPGAQLIVVTGRNTALKERLEQISWEIPTHIYGFVDNMPELMAASDLLVTKAGSCTLAEAFIAGLPVIIYSYIPGQEHGNVQYVLERQAGAHATTPAEIAQIAREWLQPGNETLAQVVANARALARPRAIQEIAQRLHSLLQVQPSLPG